MTTTRIEGVRGFPRLKLAEIWVYRELLVLLAWRDLHIRYKQTLLGVLWTILPTMLSGFIFTIIFSKLAGLSSEGLPYAAFYFAAAVPWNLFQTILTQTSTSLTGNANLLQKVYFPRLVLPLKTTLACLIDFCLACSLIVGVMFFYGLAPPAQVIYLPLFVMLALVTALGMGLWFAALNASFRDVGLILPFLTQIWFFMTPVVYANSLFPEPWATLNRINPLASVVLGFRWCLFGVGRPPDAIVGMSAFLAAMVLISGMYFFHKVERTIADII